MAGTKTGVGGFTIDNKTYDFDVDDPNAAGLDPSPVDKGDINVDNSVKDISKKTKITLADYLKNSTAANRYPINGSYTEVATTDQSGIPSRISGDPINDPQFTSPQFSGVVAENPDLQSGYHKSIEDPATKLDGLSKGKTTPAGIDGNDLLKSVSKNSLPEPLSSFTTSVLSNNRFTDSQKAAQIVTGITNDNKPGEYNVKLRHPRYGDVSMHRLAQIGTALSLRASQELNAASPGNNPTSGGQEAAALLPGFAQLGVDRVNALMLEARDVLESLTGEEVPDGDFLSIGDVSWGSLNNVDDPFSGILSEGMIALSIALTAAVTLLFDGLGFLLSLIKGSSTGAAKNQSGRYVLGRYTVTKNVSPDAFPPDFPPDIGALLGIRTTIFPLGDALSKGTNAFFGIDDSSVGSAITSGLQDAVSSPGFNVVVARTIIRSGVIVVDSFKKAFSSPNFIAGIKNILSIIDVIRSSKLIAAINVFATIGDQILSDPGDEYLAPDAIPEEPVKKSRIDSISDDSPQASVQKNRLRGSLKLAWSSNRSPSMYLIPDSILTMQLTDNKLGAFKGVAGLTDSLSKTFSVAQSAGDQLQNGSRIPYDSASQDDVTVKNIESMLDAEYMPFYFHDLRTNEIISFHAFLASLSDDYTAAWESSDAIGRVDPVKIYKSTQRKIGMSFYVVSTSEKDFDDMWMKINKLVTLLYPQYTKGRLLDNGGDTAFVQPFSQLVGASPLIRLRLGDLIKSNYSRFALARLFGAGDGSMRLDGNQIKFEGAASKLATVKLKLFRAASEANGEYRFTVSHPGATRFPGAQITPKQPQAPSLHVDGSDLQYMNLQVRQVDKTSGLAECRVTVMTATELRQAYNLNSDVATKINLTLIAKYKDTKDVTRRVVGDEGYGIPWNELSATPQTIAKIYNAEFNSDIQNIDTLSDFLSSEKNAIIKSFKSIAGKGLAGVIESMNFDWFEKSTWDDRLGHKAPKMCKVTISYAPIHDISPGIDHLGYNRAPVYSVGGAMGHGTDDEKSGK